MLYLDKLRGDVEDRTIYYLNFYTIRAVYLIDLHCHWQQKAPVGKPLLVLTAKRNRMKKHEWAELKKISSSTTFSFLIIMF